MLAYSPIGQGRLTGKYSAQNPPPGKRTFSTHPMERVDHIVEQLRRIGAAHGDKTPSQVALRWLIDKGAVPIPGAKNAAQALDNAGALGWSLTADEMATLDGGALDGTRTLQQRLISPARRLRLPPTTTPAGTFSPWLAMRRAMPRRCW
jgi:aryl-alcohol dehydrogenase-like predicted oxidoreductase